MPKQDTRPLHIVKGGQALPSIALAEWGAFQILNPPPGTGTVIQADVLEHLLTRSLHHLSYFLGWKHVSALTTLSDLQVTSLLAKLTRMNWAFATDAQKKIEDMLSSDQSMPFPVSVREKVPRRAGHARVYLTAMRGIPSGRTSRSPGTRYCARVIGPYSA